MGRLAIVQIISFLVFALIQVVLLKNLVLFNTAFCFFYIAFLLFLPVETNPLALMGLGFALGFTIDIFYDSIGLHASALVFIGFVRNFWLTRVTPQGGYDGAPTLAENGFQWLLIYAAPLIFVHHFTLFFVEAGGFSLFGYTFLKIVASSAFTLTTILIFQYVAPGGRRV